MAWVMNCATPPETTTDVLFGGRLTLRQPVKGHRAGTDSVLLASAVACMPGARIADFGAGVGTVALGAALRCVDAALTLVEIDPELAELARMNARENNFPNVEIITGDVTEAPIQRAIFDHVVMNPPFHPVRGLASPHAPTDRARRADDGLLAQWLAIAARTLRPGGIVTLIHRADALDEVLTGLRGRFGAITLVMVHPREGAAATRVLASARLGSRAPLSVQPPLVVHGPDGGFTEEAKGLHEGLLLERAWPQPSRRTARRRPDRLARPQ